MKIIPGKFIASGDISGSLVLWKVMPVPEGRSQQDPADPGFIADEGSNPEEQRALFEIPANRENWRRALPPIRHEDDVNVAAFSPCSEFICTACSNDSLRMVRTGDGRFFWILYSVFLGSADVEK